MASFTLRAHGDQFVDDVWERYVEPDRWPEWAPQIKSVSASADRLAVGVTGMVQPLIGPSIPFTVTAFDEAQRSWSWRVGWSIFAVNLDHSVSHHDVGSATNLRVRGLSFVVVPYLPLAQIALRRLVDA
jgi:hypothetical protein